MEIFLQFDISFFSVLLLCVVSLTMVLRKDYKSTSNKLMQKLIWITIYMLLLEIVSWLFDRKSGTFNYYANYLSNMLFAWSTPLITCMWASYIDYHIFKSMKRIIKRQFYLQPMFINTLFIIVNFFTPFIFSVSSENVYQREPYMWLIVLLNIMMYTYVSLMAFVNKKRINKEIVTVLLLYVFIPVIGAILQVMIFGIFILWPMMAVTIVLTYIYLETISTAKDYLTGLTSRHRLDDYLEYLINSRKEFRIIMLDLDGFKKINDEFGHIIGDQALKVFSNDLKDICHRANIISRYAGDEFVLVFEKNNEANIRELINQLKQKLVKSCSKGDVPFDIKFSYGIHHHKKNSVENYQYIMAAADHNMYLNKEKN